MNRRLILWSGVSVVAAGAEGGGAWILSLPSPPTRTTPPIAKEESDASLAALKPPKRQRPLIAIVGINDATEATDYLMPYGILRRSDIADVVLVATERGPVQLFPALRVEPRTTVRTTHSRLRRHAARISDGKRVAMTVHWQRRLMLR